MPEAIAYAIDGPTGTFARTTITRREPGPTEVLFDVVYAGICHSDIHTARGEWGPQNIRWCPTELAGIVREVGEVTAGIGDRVGGLFRRLVRRVNSAERQRAVLRGPAEPSGPTAAPDVTACPRRAATPPASRSSRTTSTHPRGDRPEAGRAAAVRRHRALYSPLKR